MIMKKLLEELRKWIAKRWERKKLLATMTKMGWECTCPGCKKYMHTNGLLAEFHETEMHWHYTCKCGFKSAWRLDAPCPMYDPSYKEPMNVPTHY